MRPTARAGILVLIVLGLATTGAGVVWNALGTTQAARPAQVLSIVPNTIGWAHTVIRWSGADGNTTVDLISGAPQVAEFRYLCQAAPGLIARGFGESGSLSVTLVGGATYSLYACTGSSSNPIFGIATLFSYAVFGLGYLSLAGILIAVVPAPLLIPRVRDRVTGFLGNTG